MMQSVYRALIRLHPRCFRTRFEEEMLRERPTPRLVADALLSLVRQWTQRPRFWTETAATPAPASGEPRFFVFADSRPHTSALLQGGILSMVAFTLIGLGLSHGEMPEVQREFAGLRNFGRPFVAGLQYAVSTPARWSKTTNLPPIPMPVSDQLLQTYTGVYVTEPPGALRIFIAFEGGGLRLAVEGEPSVKLIPSSETRFAAAAGRTQWIEFARDGAGHVVLVTIFRDGKVLHARAAGHHPDL